MNNAKMVYFEKEDILYLTISDEQEAGSVEISPNITVELNEAGELIGIEIIQAKQVNKKKSTCVKISKYGKTYIGVMSIWGQD